MNGRAILHIDMDAFFAAVEVLDNPALRGKPVIVGGTPEGRGVVAAASYEARRYGIRSAMSAWQARRRCPHAVFIRPRGRRYREVSERIFKIFRCYTPLVEPLSLDEAFLDVTGSLRLFGSAESIGCEIKRRIREEIGLTASVGVAPNKFLAKLASELEKPDGFVVITAQDAPRVLGDLPVGRLWGVGPKTQQELARLGIHKIRDLWACPLDLLENRFGPHAHDLLRFARGEDDSPVHTDGESKSISAETTFARDIADAAELRRQLDGLADEVAQRLRREGLRAHTVTLKARYPDFTTVTRSLTLRSPTSLTVAIRDAARELLERRLGRAGRALRLVGVAAHNLTPAGEGQLELFHDPTEARQERVDRLLDELQDRFGPDTIKRGNV
jgi:DNA polymerase-4